MNHERDWVHCRRNGCRRRTRNPTRLCSDRCASLNLDARVGLIVFPDGATPTEVETLFFDEVDDHRRLWCRRQAACLDFAERSGWKGMSCSICPVRDELTEEERKLSWLRTMETVAEMDLSELSSAAPSA